MQSHVMHTTRTFSSSAAQASRLNRLQGWLKARALMKQARLREGLRVNDRTHTGITALFIAAQNGCLPIVDYLLLVNCGMAIIM